MLVGIPSSVIASDAGADTTTWPMLALSQTGPTVVSTSGSLTYNATTGVLTTSLVGTVNGNAITTGTGTLTLSTFTLTVAGTASVSGTNTGDQTSVSGNSGTATALQNARTIGGVSFNGTANITVASATAGFAVSGGALTAAVITASGVVTASGAGGFVASGGSGNSYLQLQDTPSNTYGAGPYVLWINGSNAHNWVMQFNASEGLDFWYSSGTPAVKATISSAGGVTCSNLASTGVSGTATTIGTTAAALSLTTTTSGTLTITSAGTLALTGVSINHTSTGASTWTHSGGAWSLTSTSQNISITTATSGSVTIDAAGAVAIGGTTGTSLTLARTGITTTVNGGLDVLTATGVMVTVASTNIAAVRLQGGLSFQGGITAFSGTDAFIVRSGGGAGGSPVFAQAGGLILSARPTDTDDGRSSIYMVCGASNLLRWELHCTGNIDQNTTDNGAEVTYGSNSELLTLSTAVGANTATSTSANLLPAGAIIDQVVTRVTTAITSGGTVTTMAVGDPTTAARFSAAAVGITLNSTRVSMDHWSGAVTTLAAGPTQAAAAKVTITCNNSTALTAGAVRITVFYHMATPPTS